MNSNNPEAMMLNALARAIKGSPYSAVLQHTRTTVRRKGSDEVTHVRHARVLETIRGPKAKDITYTVTTEPGESADPPRDSVVVTLCRDADGLYWPGVGSTFPSDKKVREAAKNASATADDNQTVFENCD